MLTPQWNAWVKAFSGIVTVGLSYHLVFENEYNGQFGEHGKEHVFSPVRRIVQAQKDKFFGVDQAAIDAPTAVDE